MLPRHVALAFSYALAAQQVVPPAATAGSQFADFLPATPVRMQEGAAEAVATRAAVIVAGDTYPNLPGSERELPGARATAARLREGLVKHAGFAGAALRMVAGQDLVAQAVRDAIASAARQMQASDDGLLLLTWAGHGWTQKNSKGVPEQYLLTRFSRESGEAFSDAVAVTDLVEWMSAARAEAGTRGVHLKPMLLIDACRVARGAPPPPVRSIPLAAWQVFGASDGQMVQVGQGDEPFLFTGALLDKLASFAQRGGHANLEAVFAPARDATRARSKHAQVPQLVAPADTALLAAGPPALVVPRRVSLKVRCVDALAGTPVDDVVLRVNDDAMPVQKGIGQRLLAPGQVVLVAQAAGYLGRTDEVDLQSYDAGAEITLQLVPYVAVVRGRLVPAATATVQAAGGPAARAPLHHVEQSTGRDGVFELRVPALLGSELRIVQQGRVLQRFQLPAEPSAFLRDREGRHDGVPLVELVCELSDATLRELGADAPPPPPDVNLTDPEDLTDWEQAQQAIARKRWDLARSRLARIQGDPQRVGALRRQIEARWGIEQLEQTLAAGRTTGDWARVEALRAWWNGKPAVDDGARIAALFAEIERESIALPVRRAYEAANKAYAEGALERALREYEQALPGANAHYRTQIEAQRSDIKRRLYRRHASVAFQAELDGDLAKALDAYGKALEHSERVRGDVERLLAQHPLADTPRGRELAKELGEAARSGSRAAGAARLPADWACEVVDATPGATTGYPRRVKDKTSGMLFVLVEPGAFARGANDGDADERPVHQVRITAPFYLAQTETTVAQWKAFVAATAYTTDAEKGSGGLTVNADGDDWMQVKEATWRRPFPIVPYTQRDDHPVVLVSWGDARAYARWLNGGGERPFRLPSEAEWEYAARAGTTTAYFWGDPPAGGLGHGNFADETNTTAFPKRPWANFAFADGHVLLAPVGSFAANPWGFADILGNVLEWCEDWYGAGYYASCGASIDDPPGPPAGAARVLRGGSFSSEPRNVRVSKRSEYDIGVGYVNAGFRVARSL